MDIENEAEGGAFLCHFRHLNSGTCRLDADITQ